MTLYELVFVLLFLGSLLSLLVAAFLGRRRGLRILVAVTAMWAVYLVILTVSDVFSSQKVFKIAEDQCFDEMCFAVTDLQITSAPAVSQPGAVASRLYAVEVRVTSHSRGRAQAEGGLRGRLYENGAYINVSEAAQKAYEAQYGESSRLTQKIPPGESTVSVLLFEVPPGVTHPALTLDHGFTPGYFVIGESPFLHKPDIHQLRSDW
jgi:hypothetical protein